MATAVDQLIDQAARAPLDRRRGLELHELLPETARPKSLAQAYGIQQAMSHELGAIGGWQICLAEPASELAAAPLPITALRPEPARLRVVANRRIGLKPALAFRLGRSLPEYDAPFDERAVATAIESTQPAVLFTDSRLDEEGAADDPLTAIAASCGAAGLIYGRATPGLPQVEMVEIRSIHWFGSRHESMLGTVRIGKFLLPLTWLANFGASWAGGLMVGQMVALPLAPGPIPLKPGAWTKLVIEGFGSVTARAERAAS